MSARRAHTYRSGRHKSTRRRRWLRHCRCIGARALLHQDVPVAQGRRAMRASGPPRAPARRRREAIADYQSKRAPSARIGCGRQCRTESSRSPPAGPARASASGSTCSRLRPRQAAGHSGLAARVLMRPPAAPRVRYIRAHAAGAILFDSCRAVRPAFRAGSRAPVSRRDWRRRDGPRKGPGRGRARSLMGGVGDQQSTVAPAFRDRRMEHVAGGAFEVGVLGRDPALQQTPDMARFGHHRGVFVGAQRDLPAPALIDAAHIGRRSGGIAELTL